MAERQPELVEFVFTTRLFQNTERHQHRAGTHVVIGGLYGQLAPRPATPRKRPDVEFCLGVDRHTQAGGVLPRPFARCVDVFEDGVGLANFF